MSKNTKTTKNELNEIFEDFVNELVEFTYKRLGNSYPSIGVFKMEKIKKYLIEGGVSFVEFVSSAVKNGVVDADIVKAQVYVGICGFVTDFVNVVRDYLFKTAINSVGGIKNPTLKDELVKLIPLYDVDYFIYKYASLFTRLVVVVLESKGNVDINTAVEEEINKFLNELRN